MKTIGEFLAIYPEIDPEAIKHIYIEAYNVGLDAALKTQAIDGASDLDKRLKGCGTEAAAKPITTQP